MFGGKGLSLGVPKALEKKSESLTCEGPNWPCLAVRPTEAKQQLSRGFGLRMRGSGSMKMLVNSPFAIVESFEFVKEPIPLPVVGLGVFVQDPRHATRVLFHTQGGLCEP